jgi:hypothetical protein
LEAGTDLISVGWDWILGSFEKFSISAGERVRHLAAEGQWISGIWVRAWVRPARGKRFDFCRMALILGSFGNSVSQACPAATGWLVRNM